MKNIKPFYDNKFHQWCITYEPKGGGYAAVWADTEEDCIQAYENARKEDNMDNWPDDDDTLYWNT